jgi:hypothetical protein
LAARYPLEISHRHIGLARYMKIAKACQSLRLRRHEWVSIGGLESERRRTDHADMPTESSSGSAPCVTSTGADLVGAFVTFAEDRGMIVVNSCLKPRWLILAWIRCTSSTSAFRFEETFGIHIKRREFRAETVGEAIAFDRRLGAAKVTARGGSLRQLLGAIGGMRIGRERSHRRLGQRVHTVASSASAAAVVGIRCRREVVAHRRRTREQGRRADTRPRSIDLV